MESKPMERQLYIPTIGDEVTLVNPWIFGLYHEYRNEKMIYYIFPGTRFNWRDMTLPSGEKSEYGSKIADVELPKGAVLKVDRIYIRKGRGMKDYDSVTFILQSVPKKTVPEQKPFNRKPRFWAKLKDVNQMIIILGKHKLEEEDRPLVRRMRRLE